jgi:TPP-dependent pyruvate/acetoin dehydrogenase alpha subunit
MSDRELRIPDVATTTESVIITRWLVEEGQTVRQGQPIVEVETDKSIVEIESVASGVLRSIIVPAGQTAMVGQSIAIIDTRDSSAMTPFPNLDASSAENAAPRSRIQHTRSVRIPGKVLPSSAIPSDRSAQTLSHNALDRSASPDKPDQHFLVRLYEQMVLIREFEEGVKRLFLEGTMPGTIHQCQGQEATAVGVCAALEEGDFITSTFRGHGHALAKGLSPESLLFELFGAATGCCNGKGGSMHIGDMRVGMVPGIAIVGGGVPLAAGMALAFKMQNRPNVVVCFFGDGAVAEGAFHEGINLAAIWNLPALFVCENNQYGASTHIDQVMRNSCIADRAAAYGIPGITVDGNDVLAVYRAARAALNDCRSGKGPILLELLTYRRTGHSRRDTCQYQPEEERDEWFRRDPISTFGAELIQSKCATQIKLDAIHQRIQAEFQSAVERAQQQPMPTPEDVLTDVFA